MNIRKYLQERAEKDAEKLLTEEDELFIKELANTYIPKDKKEKPRRKRGKRNKQKE